MNNIVNFPERPRIQEEASYWLIRLDSGPLSDEDAKAFSEWLHASSHHTDAVIELCKVWDNMEILSELSVLFPFSSKTTPVHEKTRFLHRPVLLFAAAVVLFLVTTVVFVQVQSRMGESKETASRLYEVAYQTAVGEQKSIMLPDGSSANLNTDSLVVINFSNHQRGIRLVRGEAYFKVAHEPDRPFLVHAADGIVRAVGTAFSVRIRGMNMEVTVTDGKVELASVLPDKIQVQMDNLSEIISVESLITLEAGQTADFSNNAEQLVMFVEPEVISRKLSWQHGLLEFKGETLEEVVSEISRYTDIRIIISDESIRNIRIGGYFRAGEVEALLSVLQNGFPVEIKRIDNSLIYLAEAQEINLN